jgi:CRP/FNR family transcriptional regulator, anaerobic regulatory protein
MPTIRFPLHRPELHDLLIRGEAVIRAAMGSPVRRRKGDVLIDTGQESRTVYLLESGWVARTRIIQDGPRQIIFVFLPGDLMGIKSMLLERQPDTIDCLTDVQVRSLDHKRLLELVAQDHSASLRTMFQLAEDERRLHNWIAALGKGNAEERIATLLLDLRGRLTQAGLANGHGFRMPMTQQEIADHLGLTLVHVNRVLRRLREAGIVTVQHGVVSVDEIGRLSRLAAPLQDIYERATPEFGGQADGAQPSL